MRQWAKSADPVANDPNRTCKEVSTASSTSRINVPGKAYRLLGTI